MKEKTSLIISIVIAILLSVAVLYGVYTLVNTTQKTNQVVAFINQQITASQKASVPAK